MSPFLLAKPLRIEGSVYLYFSKYKQAAGLSTCGPIFRLFSLIFLDAFTRSATLCCCTVKTIRTVHTPLAMLKQEASSCDPCSWNSKCIKNCSLGRTNSISKSSFWPQNHGWWPLGGMYKTRCNISEFWKIKHFGSVKIFFQNVV